MFSKVLFCALTFALTSFPRPYARDLEEKISKNEKNFRS